MTVNADSLFGLSVDEQTRLSKFMPAETPAREDGAVTARPVLPDHLAVFSEMPAYKQLQVHHAVARKMGILNPFFACHEGMAKSTTRIEGREFLNFSTYDYLDLNGHPKVCAAAEAAIRDYGTSAGASRLVSGERPPHRLLEKSIAELYESESALIFVSGHATNVSTLATILTAKDAVYHDALAHNSIIQGALLSGAQRYSYAHNDCDALEKLLLQTRARHQRAVIVSEGLFSMDGSVVDLPRLIELKKEFKAFLMIDEAHALGVLGATGKGSAEHFDLDPREVDIWMGTMSKTMCGCGGFIAGSESLIELLRFRAPGFVFSVGMSPPLAAASNAALACMREEPHRVKRLAELSAFFLREAKARGLDTGYAQGHGIVPVIVGSSLVAGLLGGYLFEREINVMPIIYPVVEEGMARLRFFLSAAHNEQQIRTVLDITAEELAKAREAAVSALSAEGERE